VAERTILAISGSLRHGSHNRALLAHVAAHAPDDVELDVYEGLASLPAFDEDAEATAGPEVRELRRRIREADGLLIATPEYNGSIPGALKNALDWASRPLGRQALLGKPVAVLSASTGQFGAAWSQADLRKVLGISGARVLPLELAVGRAQTRFDAEGGLADEELADALAGVLAGLVALVDDSEREALEEAVA
jgi:chromate reductase